MDLKNMCYHDLSYTCYRRFLFFAPNPPCPILSKIDSPYATSKMFLKSENRDLRWAMEYIYGLSVTLLGVYYYL